LIRVFDGMGLLRAEERLAAVVDARMAGADVPQTLLSIRAGLLHDAWQIFKAAGEACLGNSVSVTRMAAARAWRREPIAQFSMPARVAGNQISSL